MNLENDYCEIICEAIDTIVSKKLQDLSYDITKICTIVDDTEKERGKYIVFDELIKFDAYSMNTTYNVGDSVIVIIPNGDYKYQKTIINKIAIDDVVSSDYISPLSTMLKFKQIDINLRNNSLLANGDIYLKQIGTLNILKDDNYSRFDRIGISADFTSLLGDFNTISGNYGLKLNFNKINENNEKSVAWTQYFSSNDMIGDPYNFEIGFTQEKVFDISFIQGINSIDIYFYQDNNFKNIYDVSIPHKISGNLEEGIEDSLLSDNLFVNNLSLFFGYEKGAFQKDELRISTTDLLSYQWIDKYNDKVIKNITLDWVHQIINESGELTGEFQLLDNKNFDFNNFEIFWLQYKLGELDESVDSFVGPNWKRLPINSNNPFKCSFEIDTSKDEEKIKVIGRVKNQDNWIQYESNILTFENIDSVVDNTTYRAVTGLSITCLDNSEGNYFIYNQNNKIINEGKGNGFPRKLEIRYQNIPLGNKNCELQNIQNIKWKIPIDDDTNNLHTMLVNLSENKEYYGQYQNLTYEPGYIIINKPVTDGIIEDSEYYMIKNNWHQANSINTIYCEIVANDTIYKTEIELRFGKSGTSGTNITLFLDFMDGKNAAELYEKDGYYHLSPLKIECLSYDIGNKIMLTGQWEWSWLHKLDEDEFYLFDIKKTDSLNVIELIPNENIFPANDLNKINSLLCKNYSILQLKFIPIEGTELITYLSIPIKDITCLDMEGARDIIYDYQGIPSYYTDAYSLNFLNHNVENLDWALYYDEDVTVEEDDGQGGTIQKEQLLTKDYIPKLKLIKNNQYGLSASPFYAKGYNDKVCVICGEAEKDENNNILQFKKIYWSQPILIMQSQYDSAMLNDWNGTMTVDEKSSTIFSAMLGAGRKNPTTNTFSGILIGDISDALDDKAYEIVNITKEEFLTGSYYIKTSNGSYELATEYNKNNTYYQLLTLTGVYGLQNGQISFSLKENGIATFGQVGKGQIILGGDSNIISSSNYFSKNTGLLLDIDDGILEIKNNNTLSFIISDGTSDKPYLKINDIDNNIPVLNIEKEKFYLQSSNFDLENKKGLNINLKTGRLNCNDFILSSKEFILNTQDENYPIKISDKFQLNWNGRFSSEYTENEKPVYIGTIANSNNELLNILDKFKIMADGTVFYNGVELNTQS